MSDSTYHVIELIGSSSDSWELAAQNAVREAAKAYKDLARRRGGRDGRADRERRDHRLPHQAAVELQARRELSRRRRRILGPCPSRRNPATPRSRRGWAGRGESCVADRSRWSSSTSCSARRVSDDAVDPGHLDVLDLLSARGDLRMTDLAAELGVDPSTVTRTLQRMEAAGLAKRVPDGGDGRVVKAQMTAEGIRLHAVVAARRTAILDTLFESFGTDDRAQLVGLLERFIDSIDVYATRRLAEQRTAAPGSVAGWPILQPSPTRRCSTHRSCTRPPCG